MTGCVFAKTSYPTEAAAVDALRTIRLNSTRRNVPKRAYRCQACGSWHLTKRKPESDRAVRARHRRTGKW